MAYDGRAPPISNIARNTLMKYIQLTCISLLLGCGPAVDEPGPALEPGQCDLSEPRVFRETPENSELFWVQVGGGLVNLRESQGTKDGGRTGELLVEEVVMDVCSGRVVRRERSMMRVGSVAVGCQDGGLGVLDERGRVHAEIAEGVGCSADGYRGPDVPHLVVRDGEFGFLTPDLELRWTGVEIPTRPLTDAEQYGDHERASWDSERLLVVTPQDELVHVDGESAEVTVLAGGVQTFLFEDGGSWVLGVDETSGVALANLDTLEVFEVPEPLTDPLDPTNEVVVPFLRGRFVIWQDDPGGWSGSTGQIWTPQFGETILWGAGRSTAYAAAGGVLARVHQDDPEIVHLQRVGSDPANLLEDVGEVQVKVGGAFPPLQAHDGRIFYGGTEVPLDASTAGPYREVGAPTAWLDDRVVTQIGDTLVQFPLGRGESSVIVSGLEEPDQIINELDKLIDVTESGAHVVYAKSDGRTREYWYHPLGAL